MMSSCSPAKFCAKHFPPQVDTLYQSDTTWIERYVDIVIPGDTVEVYIPIVEIDRTKSKPTVKTKKSKQASVKLTIDQKGISAEAICAEQDSIIKYQEAVIKNLTKVTSTQHIPVTKKPWYHDITLYWSLMTLPAIAYWLLRQATK